MMPLTYASAGQENVIKRVAGKPEVRQHLETMGFVVGAIITVISSVNGNLIVNVKNTRVALDQQLANKIMI
jgi:ferrous iron transport protein A